MFTINQLGTFDLENYGDLLYPIVFRNILQRQDTGLDVCQYSFLAGDAPQEAGFKTHSIQTLFDAESQVTRGLGGSAGDAQVIAKRIVIGGGDILRTDWDVVATPYSRGSRGQAGLVRRSLGAPNFLSYQLLRPLPAWRQDAFFANRFRRRWMNYPAVGPFLIDPNNLAAGSTVSYLSCGVPHEIPSDQKDNVKRALDHAQFIYVRDEQSAEKLGRCGVQREIHVAPDLIVTLSEQFDHTALARKGQEILAGSGVKDERPIICFQSKDYPHFQVNEILEHLLNYQTKTDSQVILLPLGYCHSDHEFLQRLATQSGGALKYINLYSVFDLMSVIAASDLFVGTSLHGNITAFSFGIPHLIGPLPVDKADGFLRAVDLPLDLKLRSWNELTDKIEMARRLGGPFFSSLARNAKQKVNRVVGELLKVL